MNIKVQKWGNSLAVRIPKAVSAAVAVRENAIVDVSVVKKSIVLRPVRRAPLRLRDLVKGITKENMHHEVHWGQPVGKEVW